MNSEVERLRFDIRELTLSRDGWRERCERVEGELADCVKTLDGCIADRDRLKGLILYWSKAGGPDEAWEAVWEMRAEGGNADR